MFQIFAAGVLHPNLSTNIYSNLRLALFLELYNLEIQHFSYCEASMELPFFRLPGINFK